MNTPPAPEQPLRKSRNKTLLQWGGVVLVILGVLAVVVPWLSRIPALRMMSRTRGDLRGVAVSIEEYRQAHGTYPPVQPFTELTSDTELLALSGGSLLGTVSAAPREGKPGLTTPVAYLSSLSVDVHSRSSGLPFAYHENGDSWILYSAAMDQRYNIRHPDQVLKLPVKERRARLLDLTFDPSNGTFSAGDIWVTAP